MFDNARMFLAGTDVLGGAAPGVDFVAGTTGAIATALAGTIVDLGVGDTLAHKVVAGQALSGILTRYESDLEYLVQVTKTCTSGGSATLALTLYNSTSSTLASGNTQIGAALAATAVASLVIGLVCLRGSLKGQRLASRYLGVQSAIAVATLTAGTLYGGLGLGLLSAQNR